MKQPLFFLLAVGLLFAGCSGDEDIPDTNFIVAGNSLTADVHSSEQVLRGNYNQPDNMNLDVNNDGVDDLRLQSIVWGSPGMGQHPSASLISLHADARLSGRLSTDTTWKWRKVTYSQEPGQPVVVSTVMSFNCLKEDPSSEVEFIYYNKFRLNYFTQGASLFKTDVYQADTLYLTDEWLRFTNSAFSADTIWNSLSEYDYSCWSMPDDEVRYIGFCLYADNRQRLGWIKLKVKNSLEVHCSEWAIQP